MRFRTDNLRRNGRTPIKTLHIPNWCGCSTEYVPAPETPGWWCLVAIWEPDRVANPMRRYEPVPRPKA